MGSWLGQNKRGELENPVVIVIDLTWMRAFLKRNKNAFSIFMGAYYDNEGIMEDLTSGHQEGVEVRMKWLNGVKAAIETAEPSDVGVWDWIRKNIPQNVLQGWDVGIGKFTGMDELISYLNNNFKNQMILVLKTEDILDVIPHLDQDHSLDLRLLFADGLIIDELQFEDDQGWLSLNDTSVVTTLLPKGLFKLDNLKNIIFIPNSINYKKLKYSVYSWK